MKQIIYEVHSDVDENNLFTTFYGKGSKQAAIAYAKSHIEDKCWVDKVEYDPRTEDYEYCGAAWCYDWE